MCNMKVSREDKEREGRMKREGGKERERERGGERK